MFRISNRTISLTRGDTARITVTVTNEITGEEYVIGPGDTLKFSVKKTVSDPDYTFQIVSEESSMIHIQPEDTRELESGKYLYDIELTTTLGDVYTVVPISTLEIVDGIT